MIAPLLLALAVVLLSAPTRAQSARGSAASCSSQEFARAADSVAAAFDTHQFVFIGSTHGGKKSHDFLLCLLSRPGFQRRVTDVLVEWGNPVHQAMVDDYLLKLRPVPVDSLRPVWVDTDAPQLWGRLPLIPEFYEAVRSINARPDPARRMRVIGGSEPIDWSRVKTANDVAMYPFKNNWAAHVITDHFLPHPQRKLLVVYGEGHIHHNGGNMMGNLYARIPREKLFVVGTIDAPGPDDDVARIARLGNVAVPFFVSRAWLPSAGPYPRHFFYVRDKPLAHHVDGVLYLGPASDLDMSNKTELSLAETAEKNRRDAIKGDLRELMRLRLGNRENWFRTHPDDLR